MRYIFPRFKGKYGNAEKHPVKLVTLTKLRLEEGIYHDFATCTIWKQKYDLQLNKGNRKDNSRNLYFKEVMAKRLFKSYNEEWSPYLVETGLKRFLTSWILGEGYITYILSEPQP